MNAPPQKLNPSESEYRANADPRPSRTLAFVVSLMVHTLLVFALYRAYSEITGPPAPAVQIVARETARRRAATPVFAAVPLAATNVPEKISRPAAREATLPHQSATLVETASEPVIEPLHATRRSTALASLPSTPIELPTVDNVLAIVETESTTVAPPVAVLPRTHSLPVPPVRIAARPNDGSGEHRPIGLAVLPKPDPASPARQPTDAFAQRGFQTRMPRVSRPAIDLGLEYLARVQLDDGRWRFDQIRDGGTSGNLRANAAATGLALLAFLGAGHDHFDGRYHFVVQDGLQFLLHVQQEQGNFFRDDHSPEGQITRFYSHGIATLALCEALGMTGDDELRRPAQRALNYLAGSQDPERCRWRYIAGVNSDYSATGWQLAALRTGQLAGLHVEQDTLARVRECLAMCRARETDAEMNRDIPSPSAAESQGSSERQPNSITTAVGLAVDLHLGGSPRDQRLRPAADHLLAHPPEVVDLPDTDNPRRDTYYWYYGSEAMYHLGGDDWQAWSQKFYPHLLQSQVRSGPLAGSWNPHSAASNAGTDFGGRLYLTAMNLLSLEIQQRQLPLKDATVPQVADRPQ